jgi:predicted translin family RNA/ssDNA-binding protein
MSGIAVWYATDFGDVIRGRILKQTDDNSLSELAPDDTVKPHFIAISADCFIHEKNALDLAISRTAHMIDVTEEEIKDAQRRLSELRKRFASHRERWRALATEHVL